jgi:hypothetical protein
LRRLGRFHDKKVELPPTSEKCYNSYMARTLVKVEDIDVELEQEHYDTCMRIYATDWCGSYSTDGTKRLIVWVDPDDDDPEYPVQYAEWYPAGSFIPLDVR